MKQLCGSALLVIVGLARGVAAQEADPAPQEAPRGKPEDAYVQGFDRELSLRAGLNYNKLAFLIFDQTKQNETLVTYRPNSNAFMRLDVGYLDFGLGGSLEMPGTAKSAAKYGETSAADFQAYYYGTRLGADLFYQRYAGFFGDLEGAGGSLATDRPIRDDLRMFNVGGNVYYVFSDRFSLKAAFRQTERQVKTGYSFLLGGAVSYFSVDADDSLVIGGDPSDFGRFATYRGGDYLNLSILPGFAVTYLPGSLDNRLYMTFLVLGGAGITRANAKTESGARRDITDNYKVNAKYGIGYNGDMLFTGASIVLDLAAASTFSKSTFNVGSGVIFIDAFVGMRFDT